MTIGNLEDAHTSIEQELQSIKIIQMTFQETLNNICQSLDQLRAKITELHTNQGNNHVNLVNLISQQIEHHP